MTTKLNVEAAVKERYSQAAQTREASLCCPVDYNRQYLQVIPQEVIEKDYGCGNPSQHLRPGEVVLDLGSGSGKICFIASQIVGPTGKVIGVDMNDDMLGVARKHMKAVGDALGYHNVDFRKGRIQDLALDLEKLDEELRHHPIQTADAFLAAEARAEDLRVRHPLVQDDSVDVVVSNCVLNLVDSKSKNQLFREIFRVLRKGGRAVISDIVSDEPVPEAWQNDPQLWSGCLSGALTEQGFLEAFEEAGFYGSRILQWDAQPWRTVHGIEFRSMTLEALKGKQGHCFERNQAVMYKGPFKEVLDDDGHRLVRGMRYAVCDKTYQLFRRKPYQDAFFFVDPRTEVPVEEAAAYDCLRPDLRHPKETKGQGYSATSQSSSCCDAGNCC